MADKQIVLAAVFGHSVADALGVPVEFVTRTTLQKNPVSDMLGFGTHNVPVGTWSDDTSMMLCTAESILQKGRIDLNDIMLKFCEWLGGYMTPFGKPFGIGRTCLKAIDNYRRGKSVFECGMKGEHSCGNGALMRILPVSLYNCFLNLSNEESFKNISNVTALTHSHEKARAASLIYDVIVRELIKNPSKQSVTEVLEKTGTDYEHNEAFRAYSRLFERGFCETPMSKIGNSGYAVDTLEAAVWSLLNTDSYKDCVLKAVNLGGDTDTIGAVSGALAGILYGFDSIPAEWIKCLALSDDINLICEKFSEIF